MRRKCVERKDCVRKGLKGEGEWGVAQAVHGPGKLFTVRFILRKSASANSKTSENEKNKEDFHIDKNITKLELSVFSSSFFMIVTKKLGGIRCVQARNNRSNKLGSTGNRTMRRGNFLYISHIRLLPPFIPFFQFHPPDSMRNISLEKVLRVKSAI
eukprot:g26894.t1